MVEEKQTTGNDEMEQLVVRNRELIEALKRLQEKLVTMEYEDPEIELLQVIQENIETKEVSQ